MNPELEEYKRRIEDQVDRLLGLLATIGLGDDPGAELKLPDPKAPLANLYAAIQIVAARLGTVTGELRAKTLEAERSAGATAERDATLAEQRATIREQGETIKAQAEAIAAHAAALREQSTPVVQVLDDILVLPLIGALDSARADQVMAQALDGITAHSAAVLIVDITGMTPVDSRMAAHLLQTCRAVRMLGADCVLTGVDPRTAQNLAAAGIDLAELRARGSLRAGLEYALAATGRVIRRLPA